MAEGIVVEGKTVEELEREITCGICQEHYTEPNVLPCLHYYCKKCVLRLALRTGTGKPFSCPECRCEATLPEGGVDELKTAFFVNRLKTTVSTMERAHGKVEVKCELCSDSGDKAEAFCRQCAMFICKDCINQHKRLKTYLTHEVASLEDLKQGRAKPIAVKEPPTKSCPNHDEPLIIYCFDCESLICHHCTVKDHRDHDFEFCKIASSKTKQNLLENLNPLKIQKESLVKAIDNIQITTPELKAQGGSVASSIQTSFKELREILDMREQELLGEAAEIVQQKMDKLSVQEKTLSLASAEVQSVVDYTEQCVRHCTDNEVMSTHAEIRRRIEREIKEYSKSGRSLEPVEEVDIGVEVRCAKALQQLCQTQINIIQLPIDPAKCTVTMGDSTKHEVNKTSHATLVTRLSSNKISRRHCKVSCSLRSLYNNVITECKVGQTGAGQYSIQCTPTVRGRHELTVSVDGQQVAGSPFPVVVSIPPTQLGKPVKVWTNLTGPTGITVNSVGEILVSEYRGNIIKFDTEGNRRILVEQDRMINLRKLDMDGEDNIYCIDNVSNRIFRCDRNGGNIKVQEVMHVKVGQRGLAVVGEEVMVCVKDNRGTIMVYDKELNHVRSIEHRDMGYFRAISADSHGNLYCSDKDNTMIQVFSNDGVFLRSFGSDGEGEKKVKGPCGLCVSGHYVYVCNSSYNILVFTTDGVYVTSFGQCGSNEGDFNWPHSVCVDQDGFVYVTEYNNNRVQCF